MAESIHDDSIQVIAAMGMRLQMLRRTIGDPEQLGMLAEAEQTVQLSIARLPALVFELHPPGSSRRACRSRSRSPSMRPGATAATSYRLDDQLPSRPPRRRERSCSASRRRRSRTCASTPGPRSVVVTLLERDHGYAVRIADDGCGCEPELAAAGSEGAGFASMRARAALANGSLRVDSAPGAGTTVEAWLPARPAGARTGGAA